MATGLKTLVFFACMPFLLLQMVYNGLITTSVSSIQTKYLLSGVDVGIIMGMLDFGAVIMLIVVALVGENVNKPKWLGVNSIVIAVGAFIFTLPHFIAPPYEYKTSKFVNYCANVTEPECTDNGQGKKNYMYVSILGMGMAIVGGGSASIFTHGITYIDDNSTTRQSSIYVSVFLAMATIGVVVGYIIGGALTEMFEDPFRIVDIDSNSPFWVGAWWPGYILAGLVLMIVAIPLSRLPRRLPSVCVDKDTKDKESTTDRNKSKFNTSTIKYLLSNPIFMLATMVVALTQAFTTGFNTFAVKYVEAQYGLTTFLSSVVFGIAAVFCITLAHITSGTAMAKLKLDMRGLIRYCIGCAVLSVIFTFGFFFFCDDVKFAGGTVQYDASKSGKELQLSSSCNMHCGCTTDWYSPVRGSNGFTYYSACYAGCDLSTNTVNSTYGNCSCILDDCVSSKDSFGTAVPLENSTEFCTKLFGFVVTFGIAVYTSVLAISPTTQITIRNVGDQRKSAAIGFQQVLGTAIGNIPGRVITGKVMDSACVVWSTKCHEQASCKVYKKWDMALFTFLLLVTETCVILALYIAMHCIHKSRKPTVKFISPQSINLINEYS